MIGSHELRGAAVELRRAAADLDAREARHQLVGAGVRASVPVVAGGWVSPASERWQGDAQALAAALHPLPSALRGAAVALRQLAVETDGAAVELAGHERALAGARDELQRVAGLRMATLPDDVERRRQLDGREREAHRAVERATAGQAGVAGRWSSAARRASHTLTQLAGEVARAAPPGFAASLGGPRPNGPGGGVLAPYRPPEDGAGDWARWSWDAAAAPALTGYLERRRYGIFHLGGGPVYERPVVGHEWRVRAQSHWRQPRALQPGSPLAGTPRVPTLVNPSFDDRPRTEFVSGGPRAQVGEARGVATRFKLDRSLLSRHVRFLGPAASVAEVGLAGADQYQADRARDDLSGGERFVRTGMTAAIDGGATVGVGALGAKGGAAGGAALGTLVLPGIGTAVGAVGGAVVGGIAGSTAGSWVGSKVSAGVRRAFGGDGE